MNCRLQEIERSENAITAQERRGKRREDRRWAEAVLAGEKRVLEMIARNSSLCTILEALCRLVEQISSDSLCSVFLLDANGEHLFGGAAPSLPKGYTDAINGRTITDAWGPCGMAAFRKEPVIVSNIRLGSPCAEFRDLALAHGLQACWSTPILSSDAKVLGTFSVYGREPRSPSARQRNLMEQFAHLASIAIERSRGEEALRRSQSYLAEAQKLSHTGSFGWNVSTGELVWSDETFRLLGYDSALKPSLELVLKRVHPADAPLVKRMIEVASREATNLDFQHRLLMPDGSVKHVEVIGHALKNNYGGVEFVGAVMDVTEHKRAEALVEGEKRLLEMIARGGALGAILDALCRFGEEVSSNVLVSILLVSPDGKSLRHGAAPSLPRSYTEAIDGAGIGPRAGSCGTAVYRRQPVMVSDISSDPLWVEYRQLALPHRLKACWSTPIFSTTRRVIGTFALYCHEPGSPTLQHQNLIERMTHLAAVAIERNQASQALRATHEIRQVAVLAERDRMARDIHDTLAQGFTGVIMQLEAAEEAMSQRLAKKAEEHVTRAGELAREGLREARRSVRALRPQVLDQKNLSEALEDLLQRMTAGTNIRAEFSSRGEPRRLPPEWEENLLRVGQEVLTNVLRHARASKFKAELVFDNGGVGLDLRDNGNGFDPARRHDGFGLQGMRERVEGMGGRLSLESAKGQGTAISIIVPVANSWETAMP
jgi:signal transduction histidine kinase/PAS domain-containing protein